MCAVQPAVRADGEGRRVQVGREIHVAEHGGGVVLDVRVERPVRLVLVQQPKRGLLDVAGEAEPLVAARERRGDLAERPCARVVGAVDAMPEAHQALARVELLAQPGLGVLGRADLVDHVRDVARRATVQPTLERTDGADQTGAEVGERRDDHARRERRRVHAVLGCEREVRVERAGLRGIRCLAAHLQHEVLDQAQPGLCRHDLGTGAHARDVRDERGGRRERPDRVVRVAALRAPPQRRPRAQARAQHVHRERVRQDQPHRVVHLGRHDHAGDDLGVQGRELTGVRQLTVPQQVGDLLETVLLGEALGVVAAVDQTAVLTVDEGDLRAPERDALEAGPGQIQIVRHRREV